jgi:hypothetical protein
MSDLIRWILSDFWRFAGAVILLAVVGSALADIVRAARG